MDKFVVFLRGLDLEFGCSFLDGAKCFQHQHRMMRHDRATSLAYDNWMRYAFGIAYVHDVPNHVIGVFLERVIRRAVEIASGPVVIYAEPPADIQIAELVSKFDELRVVARPLTHGASDG